jgi:peptidyl-prolyl cis-trans isomerase B (cyclophilin B)
LQSIDISGDFSSLIRHNCTFFKLGQNMNKLYSSIILLMLTLTLASCGQDSTETKAQPESTKAENVESETTEPETQEKVEAETQEEAAEEPVEVVKTEAPDQPSIDKTDPAWKLKVEKPELMSFDPAKSYFWEMETNHGAMKFKLYPDTAPMHATSTIYLTKLGFYDNVIFHRIIPGFMAQGGDPTGTGRSGPAYKYSGEFDGGRHHDKPGLLSMANAGPGTDGSQFFITFVPTPHLDGKHTIFGELIEGMDTLATLESKGSRSGRTSEKLEIIKATISIE